MRSLNRVTLIGHLGRDPEMRYTPAGTAVCEFSIATSEQWKDKQTGEAKERTEWHTVTVWSRLAEIAAEYLKKGARVYIEGKIRTDKYTDRDGQDRYRTKIQADNLIMLDRQERQEGTPSHQEPSREQPRAQRPAERPPADEFDDDIPF